MLGEEARSIMAIAHQMSVEGNVLYVKASGRDESEEEVKQYGLAVIQMALAHGAERVLCEETELEYALETFSTYEAAKFIAEVAPKICRVAIVCSPRDAESGAFWETVAVNRGLNVRVTTDLQRAKAWITEGIDQPKHAMDGEKA